MPTVICSPGSDRTGWIWGFRRGVKKLMRFFFFVDCCWMYPVESVEDTFFIRDRSNG